MLKIEENIINLLLIQIQDNYEAIEKIQTWKLNIC